MIDLCCLGDILEVIYRKGWWTEEVVNEGVKIKARAIDMYPLYWTSGREGVFGALA